MLSREEIATRLQLKGFEEKRVEAIIADVMQVVLGKALAEYLKGLPEEARAKMQGLPAEEMAKYVAEHKDELPPPSAADFEKKYEETWEEYFQAIA